MIGVFLLFLLCGGIFAGPAELPFRDDFNAYPIGAISEKPGEFCSLGPWTAVKRASVIQLVEGIEGSTGKCVKLEHRAGDRPIWLSLGFKPVDKYLRAEVRVRRADVKSISTWYIARMAGTKGYSAVTTIKGEEFYYKPGTGKYTRLQRCEPDTWYTVRVDINFPEKNYDVYIDGKLLKFMLPFHVNKKETANEASSFQIAGALEVEGTIFIDSVSIEAISFEELEKAREEGRKMREKMLGG
jgi:hypothetical protein